MLLGAACLVYMQEGEFIQWRDLFTSREFPYMSFGVFVLYNLFTFGFGEETGWCGFALPRLQANYNSWWATVILTGIWAGWHIPLFLYRPGYVSMDIAGIFGWGLSLLTGSFLLSWFYNSSGGSILIVSIFHATIDLAFTSKASDGNVTMYMGMFITMWAISVIGIQRFYSVKVKSSSLPPTTTRKDAKDTTQHYEYQ
ncbi:CPBP family intramembrane metalloprotease [Rhodocytophaga aerolata]|uniref:CPBP family intramembrane metalloprotease n=1 Tax=Rhodocytophaga aerolata TaxID=455078 RepID=A0ABT8R279_9BACT|nr:CPBP family intramembrane glutamic endopeptidase [Rhodocytophaga aerolata]MDO1445403.1 CPBP family intramembrane metalloprotease [Rhodocytophaga aerolata]